MISQATIQEQEQKKVIPISKIDDSDNARKTFDKIDELASSIKETGGLVDKMVLNPVMVNGKYKIISGGRRLKALIKLGKKEIIEGKDFYFDTFKDNRQASFVNNIHRQDLTEYEKAQELDDMMKKENLSLNALSKKVQLSPVYLKNLLGLIKPEFKELAQEVKQGNIKERHFRFITKIEDKETQKELLNKVKTERLDTGVTERLSNTLIKTKDKEVKKALLNDDITIQQAESINKLKDDTARKRAIQEHKQIALVDKGIEKNIEREMTAKEKREFDKQLVQAKNWIASFRGSTTDTYTQVEKTLKILAISTKFIPLMDKTQKERLGYDLDRFLEILERGQRVAEQIQGVIDNE